MVLILLSSISFTRCLKNQDTVCTQRFSVFAHQCTFRNQLQWQQLLWWFAIAYPWWLLFLEASAGKSLKFGDILIPSYPNQYEIAPSLCTWWTKISKYFKLSHNHLTPWGWQLIILQYRFVQNIREWNSSCLLYYELFFQYNIMFKYYFVLADLAIGAYLSQKVFLLRWEVDIHI